MIPKERVLTERKHTMRTHFQGAWSHDPTWPDDFEYRSDTGLAYTGYSPRSSWDLGIESLFMLHVHCANHPDERYQYFVSIETFTFVEGVLVTDFPSLLLFLKEMLPLLQDAREQDRYTMREEEHLAWAQDRRQTTKKRDFCAHDSS
jgi:hypothetical protein